jgi:hypothetical protein
MNTQDPWAGRTWTLNDAVGDDGTTALFDVIMSSGTNQFQLVPLYDGNTLLGYRVSFAAGAMAACWNGCLLFLQGADSLGAPSSSNLPPLPLHPWVAAPPNQTPPYRKDYTPIAAAIRTAGYAQPSKVRLEGEIHPQEKGPEAVTLWQVAGVLSNKTFLSIAVRADVTTVGTRQSGIAHGNDF